MTELYVNPPNLKQLNIILATYLLSLDVAAAQLQVLGLQAVLAQAC